MDNVTYENVHKCILDNIVSYISDIRVQSSTNVGATGPAERVVADAVLVLLIRHKHTTNIHNWLAYIRWLSAVQKLHIEIIAATGA